MFYVKIVSVVAEYYLPLRTGLYAGQREVGSPLATTQDSVMRGAGFDPVRICAVTSK
jgi:hypothetical protein